MKITEKLDELQRNSKNDVEFYASKEQIKDIMGLKNLQHAYRANFFPKDTFVFFEEEGTLYYSIVNKDSLGFRDHRIDKVNGKLYDKVSEELFQQLLKEEQELKERVHILNRVTEHPTFRLKKIFLDNEKTT